MTSDPDRQAIAEIRIRMALDSLQQALELVERAAQALTRVGGMLPERRSVGSLSGQLGLTWLAVCAGARRKGHLRMD